MQFCGYSRLLFTRSFYSLFQLASLTSGYRSCCLLSVLRNCFELAWSMNLTQSYRHLSLSDRFIHFSLKLFRSGLALENRVGTALLSCSRWLCPVLSLSHIFSLCFSVSVCLCRFSL